MTKATPSSRPIDRHETILGHDEEMLRKNNRKRHRRGNSARRYSLWLFWCMSDRISDVWWVVAGGGEAGGWMLPCVLVCDKPLFLVGHLEIVALCCLTFKVCSFSFLDSLCCK